MAIATAKKENHMTDAPFGLMQRRSVIVAIPATLEDGASPCCTSGAVGAKPFSSLIIQRAKRVHHIVVTDGAAATR